MGRLIWQEIVDFSYTQRPASTRRFDQPAAAPSDLTESLMPACRYFYLLPCRRDQEEFDAVC